MGTDIGYLQNKIRELQDKIDELDSKYNFVKGYESRLTEFLRMEVSRILRERRESFKEVAANIFEEVYSSKFDKHIKENVYRMNEAVIIQKKGFNKAVKDILTEIALLKKDNNFVLNVVLDKLNISEEEYRQLGDTFDRLYPKEKVAEYLEKFKLTEVHNLDEAKKILEESK